MRGTTLGKYDKVLIEVGLATEEDVRVDYRRGILIVNRVRVGEGKGEGSDGQVALDPDKMKEAGINVGAPVIKEAVNEALRGLEMIVACKSTQSTRRRRAQSSTEVPRNRSPEKIDDQRFVIIDYNIH